MQIQEIALDKLRGHRHNANVMRPDLLAKLAGHVERSGRYPPLIVRPIEDGYEIIDGHHRLEVLRRLGHATARCVAWEVDEQESLVLLATLNRLQGQDDPKRRAALVGRLAGGMDSKLLGRLLPEQKHQLEKLMSLNRPAPLLRDPKGLERMPAVVHFFLMETQRNELERVLGEIGGSREEALMELVGRNA